MVKIKLSGFHQHYWKKRKKKEEEEDRIVGDGFEITFCIYLINSSVYG